MKKLAALSMAVIMVVAISGCGVGPDKFSRRWDDKVNAWYVNSPWMAGNTISALGLNVVGMVLGVVDDIVNVYYFWGKDAAPFGKGRGTPFIHRNPSKPPMPK